MKSVSLIIQFVIFFSIGLTFFILVGNLFRFQSDVIKNDVLNFGSNLATKQMSAAAVYAIDTCKTCDNTTIRTEVKSITNLNPDVSLTTGGVMLSIDAENKQTLSSVHNLYFSVNFVPNKVSSVKPITLTYNKTKNNLVIK